MTTQVQNIYSKDGILWLGMTRKDASDHAKKMLTIFKQADKNSDGILDEKEISEYNKNIKALEAKDCKCKPTNDEELQNQNVVTTSNKSIEEIKNKKENAEKALKSVKRGTIVYSIIGGVMGSLFGAATGLTASTCIAPHIACPHQKLAMGVGLALFLGSTIFGATSYYKDGKQEQAKLEQEIKQYNSMLQGETKQNRIG